MWVWLKLKPTPKGDNTQTDIRARVVLFLKVRLLCVQCQGVFLNFFMVTFRPKHP